MRHRAPKDEATRLDAGDLVDLHAGPRLYELVDRAAEGARVAQQRCNVAKYDARLGIIRDIADRCAQILFKVPRSHQPSSLVRQPAPWGLVLVVICCFEYGRGKCRLDMKDGRAAVRKTMLAPCRHDYQLPARQGDVLIINPTVSLSFAHSYPFLDCVQMRRRPVPGITPLLEQAKLTRIVCCRRSHARRDARPPFLAWLLIHIDDMHRFPNEFIASKGS